MTMSDRMIGNLSICDKAYRLSTGMGAVARPRGVRPAGLAVNEGLGSPAFTGGLALAFGLTTAVLIMASVHWWRATGHGAPSTLAKPAFTVVSPDAGGAR